MDPWYVYCLKRVSDQGQTYIGATIDPNRRLRQHNGEIVGGARATRGKDWQIFCYAGPFEKIEALRFEWRWKWLSRKESGTPLERRQKALTRLLEEKEETPPSVYFS